VSCVHNVASFCGLSILDCPFGFSNVYFVLCLVYTMLPVSLDCLFLIAPSVSLTFISTHLLSNLPLYDDGDVLAWSLNVYISLNCQNGAHENGTLYFKSSISHQIDQTTLKP
jgi:hypothetical protein